MFKKSKAFWFFSLLPFSVFVFLIMFFVSINYVDEKSLLLNLDSLQHSTKETKKADDRGWIKSFASSAQKGYFYPVNEISIELSLDENIRSYNEYRLDIEPLDTYRFFCLRQVLTSFNVHYLLQRHHEDVKTVLFSDKKSELQKIVKELKTYNIDAKVTHVTRKKYAKV